MQTSDENVTTLVLKHAGGGMICSPPTSQRRAGHPQQKGSRRGPAYAYNVKALRKKEMLVAAQAERSYERFVAQWKPRRPKEPARGRLSSAGLK